MDDATRVSNILRSIVAAGMDGKVDELSEHLHDDVIMALPGFGGRVEGKAAMLGGFADFSKNATVEGHAETDEQIDIAGNVAVGSYRFDITYSRDGGSWRSTGRDLWVFHRTDGRWLAVWRTMLELTDEPLESSER